MLSNRRTDYMLHCIHYIYFFYLCKKQSLSITQQYPSRIYDAYRFKKTYVACYISLNECMSYCRSFSNDACL